MENASKALIIAGAILVSLLIIGIGMALYQGAQGMWTEGVSQMSTQEKDAFNSRLLPYEGNKVTGNNVRAMIQAVISMNSTNQDTEDKIVTVNGKSSSADLSKMKVNDVNTGKTYSVTMTYNDVTGLIHEITFAVSNTK